MLLAPLYHKDGKTHADLQGDQRRPTGGLADLAFIASAARR